MRRSGVQIPEAARFFGVSIPKLRIFTHGGTFWKLWQTISMSDYESTELSSHISETYLKAIFQMMVSLAFGIFSLLMWEIISSHEARWLLSASDNYLSGFPGVDVPRSWLSGNPRATIKYGSIPGVQAAFCIFLLASVLTMIRAILTGYKASSK